MKKKIEDEIWVEIAGYSGLYAVSSLGRVKRLCERWRNNIVRPCDKLMALNKTGNGYLGLQLRKEGADLRVLVHRLVAIHFLENSQNLPQVNHINVQPTNKYQ